MVTTTSVGSSPAPRRAAAPQRSFGPHQSAGPQRPAAAGRAHDAVLGALAVLAGVGIGHGVAAFTGPSTSPLVAVGARAIDLAPTPVKTAVVSLFGTADKPLLIAVTVLSLAALGALLGLLARTARTPAIIGVALLAALGLVAVWGHPDGATALLAPAAALLVSVTAFRWVSAPRSAPEPAVPGPAWQAPTRRGLFQGAALTGAAVAGGAIGVARTPGPAPAALPPLPEPASAAPPVPAGAQVEGLAPFVTPNPDFYRIDINLLVPRHAAADWELVIDGMVENPLRLSYADLLALPMIERTITLACVSNEVGGSYVSNARWLGVPIAELLVRAGVRDGADQVRSHSLDGTFTASTPLAALTDGRDALIAVGMNGEVLPDRSGFPARMVVPGLYGYVSATKWLSRLEVTTYDRADAYWTRRGWAIDGPVLTQSRIDVPAAGGTVAADTPVIAGVAWAQHRGISGVEVRIDDGPWQVANLAADAGIDQWRQWWLPYDGGPGRHTATVRATDGTGATQPEDETPVFPRGATGWHTIDFSAA